VLKVTPRPPIVCSPHVRVAGAGIRQCRFPLRTAVIGQHLVTVFDKIGALHAQAPAMLVRANG
jgi:hypothetical protein